MGYFNYFVKCIIRNITYKLCKPKVLLVVLLSIIMLLFCFKNYGYCFDEEGSTVVVVSPSDTLTEDSSIQYDDIYLNLVTMQENVQNACINDLYLLWKSYPTQTSEFLLVLYQQLIRGFTTNGSTGIMVKNVSDGWKYKINVYDSNTITAAGVGTYSYGSTIIPNCSYSNINVSAHYIGNDNNFSYDLNLNTRKEVSAFVGVFVPGWKQLFIDTGVANNYTDSEILKKLDELIASSSNQQNQIVDKLEEQNQLQAEQNKVQKEQNDFLKQETSDNDVSIDSFNNVDSNDITSSGLTGIFNTIYNSINSWSSKDINLPIPFTNKSINISANYTSNMLNKVGRSDFNQYRIYYLLFFSC